jgi:kumamolisin
VAARHLGALAVVAVSAALLVCDWHPVPPAAGSAINGPYAQLLAAATDLGPSRHPHAQLTVTLHRPAAPRELTNWAQRQGLWVRWREGQAWAVVEGAAADLAAAFGVAVHDYRGRRGQVFYAAARQPTTPAGLHDEIGEVGRILGYVPHHTSRRWLLPQDVPERGLGPQALLTTYNADTLAAQGYRGEGSTIVFFAFDGFDQADLDAFTAAHGLPPLVPEVIGELDEPRGETTMDLQVAHAVAPDARKVVMSARRTIVGDGAFEKIGELLAEADQRYPGAVWSFSIGWGCDRLITAADLAPVRAALAAAQARGTTAFNASGDLAGLECRGGGDWSSRPGEDDVGLDSVASLPEMTGVGGTTLSTDESGRWLSEQSWYDVPLSIGTGGGVSALFDRPDWQRAVLTDRDTDRRVTPDVAAVADPFTGVQIVFAGRQLVGGGTSQSAPIWAGLTAVMNQYLQAHGGRPIGALNPRLYRMARGAPRPAFNDITLGGNAVAQAGPGYDLVTGLGSPNVANLVENLLAQQRAER